MRVALVAAVSTAAFLTTSCGGGGGNGPSTGGSAPTPTLAVTLSKSSADVTVAEGETANFGFTASYTGSSSQPVIADISIDGKRYALDSTPSVSGSNFTIKLKTMKFAPGGQTTSKVTFRLCTSGACSTIYPGSTQTFTVNLDVQLKDWATFQRDPAHTGYVAAAYDAADFKKVWEWAPQAGHQVNAAATGAGAVYLTETRTVASGSENTVAINTADGSLRWRKSVLGDVASDPAFANGFVYITPASSYPYGPEAVLKLDATTGTVNPVGNYQSYNTRLNQPVLFSNSLYLVAGYTGQSTIAVDLNNKQIDWQQFISGTFSSDNEALAVDDSYVYSFIGPQLAVLDRATGGIALTIANPDFQGDSIWDSGPILDGKGNVFAFSRARSFTTATPLAGYSVASASQIWLTSEFYATAPVYDGAYLYAANPAKHRVDAIDPANGSVVYSIDVPGTGAFISNIVATASHLFISTASNVYAFDLKENDHPLAWQSDAGGRLAITADNFLIISSANKVTAVKL